MKYLFKCELQYFPSQHLFQIYDGFEKLRKLGFVKINVRQVSGNETKPILTVILNDKYKIIYDTLDGLNWIDGSIEENLLYFKNNIKSDFYFKRSYNKQVFDHAPSGCYVFPLGFNYSFNSEDKFSRSVYNRVLNFIKNSRFVTKYYSLKRTSLKSKDFEFYPFPQPESKILFLSKLWNPEDISLPHLKIEREIINETRINYIRICKKEFGKRFLGGLEKDNFSTKVAKDLTLPLDATQKRLFVNIVKEYDICIATTGLHGSIGWKFGEYIAASRAIMSEPMHYSVPGDFEADKNYLVFKNEDELVNKISDLIINRKKLAEIMENNFRYYNNFLRPEVLVLNTLLTVSKYI